MTTEEAFCAKDGREDAPGGSLQRPFRTLEVRVKQYARAQEERVDRYIGCL